MSEAPNVYKVLRRQEWESAQRVGMFHGSSDDRRDGFIHLSTNAQLAGTITRHFAGEAELIVAAFPVSALADNLKWERSRGGKLFPHLYAPLAMEHVTQHWSLAADRNGGFDLPGDLGT